MMTEFNTEPVTFHHASSLVADEKVMLNQHPYYVGNNNTSNTDDDHGDDDHDMMDVPQNLDPEQERYEFPSKARLQQLAPFYNDNDTDSFFDESSFTTTSTSYGAGSEDEDDDDDDDQDDALESLYRRCKSPPSFGRQTHSSASRHNNDDQLDRFFSSMSHGFKSSWEREEEEEAEHQEHVDEGGALIDDRCLSPLQLPAQVTGAGSSGNSGSSRMHGSGVPRCTDQDQDEDGGVVGLRRPREESCDSAATVTQCKAARDLLLHHRSGGSSSSGSSGSIHNSNNNGIVAPCSFLASSSHHLGRVQEEEDEDWYPPTSRERLDSSDSVDLPVFCSESELQYRRERAGSHGDSNDDPRIVLVRLGSKHTPITVIRRCSSTGTGRTDEGYDDRLDDDKEYGGSSSSSSHHYSEQPIESTSTFLPLSEAEQEYLMHNDILRTAAAVKIQAAWRGHRHRQAMQQQQQGSKLAPAQRLMVDVLQLCGRVHRQQMLRVQERLDAVETHLQEETAMRIAFEKAMEDMTVLVDDQQRTLHEQLEHEIGMRQAYEQQVEATAAQIRPLEARLRQEGKARDRLEAMMARVLGEVQELKSSRQHEAHARRKLQAELDDARHEIALLKRATATTPSRQHTPSSIRPGLTVHAGLSSPARKSVAPPPTTTTISMRSRTPATPSPIPRRNIDPKQRPVSRMMRPTSRTR